MVSWGVKPSVSLLVFPTEILIKCKRFIESLLGEFLEILEPQEQTLIFNILVFPFRLIDVDLCLAAGCVAAQKWRRGEVCETNVGARS